VYIEDELINKLEDITNLHIFPVIEKVVLMRFGLKLSKEQSVKFQDWLLSKGFTKMRIIDPNEYIRLSMDFGYVVKGVDMDDLKRRVILYEHIDGKKAFIITYTIDNSVIIENVIYFEQS
jgi:hypothetical protein